MSLLVLIGVIAGLVIAELIARLLVPADRNILKLVNLVESERGKFSKHDPLLGWDGLENVENDFVWLDAKHHVLQNRFGYRGSEHDYKRTQKRRLLFLGDSFVWGFGVENNHIFTSIMEERTNNAVEIINMGVSGYGNDQELLLWQQKGHLWKPDDIILMITVNTDIWDNMFPKRYGYFKPKFQLKDDKLVITNVPVTKPSHWVEPIKILVNSSFASLNHQTASQNESLRNYFETREIVPKRAGDDGEYPLYQTKLDQDTEKAFTMMFKLIEEINEDITQRNGKLHVVIIPSVIQVYPDIWSQYLISLRKKGIDLPLDLEMPNKRIKNWCRYKNISIIDLLPHLQNAGRTNPYLYFPVNRHWTIAGHEVVADMLLNELDLRK